jgi:hypothetical protein
MCSKLDISHTWFTVKLQPGVKLKFNSWFFLWDIFMQPYNHF